MIRTNPYYLEMLHCPFCQNAQVTMELQDIIVDSEKVLGYKCSCGASFLITNEVEKLVRKKNQTISELENEVDSLNQEVSDLEITNRLK